MKKVALLFSAAVIMAQSASAFIKVGPEIGLNFSKLTYDGSGTAGLTPNLSSVTGFKAGLIADISLGHIALQPGLFYTTKGGTQDASLLGFTVKDKSTINYLELPVWIMYQHKIGPGKVFAGVAPSISLALSGKSKLSASGLGATADSTYKLTFGSDSTDLKKFDYGVNFGVGYELSMGLFLRITYSLGLNNLSNDSAFDTKNRGFGVSVGYLFGK